MVLVLAAWAPVGHAQQGAGNTVHVDDPSGDVEFASSGATADEDSHDLLRLTIGPEALETLTFSVQLADAVGPADGDARTARVQVHFTVHDQAFLLEGGVLRCDGDGRLFAVDETVGRRGLGCVPLNVDATEGTLTWSVPRTLVDGGLMRPLQAGSAVMDAWATAFTEAGFGETLAVVAQDRIPDEGTAPPLVLEIGPRSVGGMRLTAETPVRPSNGEATTVVYNLTLVSPVPGDALVEVEGLPEGWNARHPALLRLEADTPVSFPVVASIPFEHIHGDQQLFTVNTTMAGTGWAAVDVGTKWLTVPQPSGHHRNLHLHSAPEEEQATGLGALDRASAWISTLAQEVDPRTTDQPVRRFSSSTISERVTGDHQYTFPLLYLSPSLATGLDFDPNGTLVSNTAFHVPREAEQARLGLRLWHCDFTVAAPPAPNNYCRRSDGSRGATMLLANGTTPDLSLTSGTNQIQIELQVTQAADLVLARPDANIFVEIWFNSTTPLDNEVTPDQLTLLPGDTWWQLPLQEYHDPLQGNQTFGAVNVGIQEARRLANPGDTIVIPMEVENGAERQRFGFSFVGHPDAWVAIEPSEASIGSGQASVTRMVVQVPETSSVGDRLDGLFVAQGLADPSASALHRVEVRVVEDDVEGDVWPPAGTQESPLPLGLVFASLAALVASRRRR